MVQCPLCDGNRSSAGRGLYARQNQGRRHAKVHGGCGYFRGDDRAQGRQRATRPKNAEKAEPKGPEKVPGVDRILAVASGKGGVGKSTVSANLACALAAEGRRVGLLDADVYGPSQPRMLGVSGRPSSRWQNHPADAQSRCHDDVIGLMTNEGQAVVWRGPC